MAQTRYSPKVENEIVYIDDKTGRVDILCIPFFKCLFMNIECRKFVEIKNNIYYYCNEHSKINYLYPSKIRFFGSSGYIEFKGLNVEGLKVRVRFEDIIAVHVFP